MAPPLAINKEQILDIFFGIYGRQWCHLRGVRHYGFSST